MGEVPRPGFHSVIRKKCHKAQICKWHHPYGRKWRTEKPLDEVKEKSEKVGLKLNIQNTRIMAYGPITSWQTDGETVETVTDFIFLSSKITADGDCSHEIKTRLLLGRKVMTNLDSILKSRDTTLPIKVRLVKAMVFPVVMYECESWTIKKAECWRTDAFELWCWRRLLSPFDSKEIQPVHPKRNQSWIFIRRTDAELKLQYFGHLMRRTDSLEKTLMLGKIEGGRRRGNKGWDGWMASPTQWTWVLVSSGSWWWTGRPGVHGVAKSRIQLSDWTELNWSDWCKTSSGHLTKSSVDAYRRSLKKFNLLRK